MNIGTGEALGLGGAGWIGCICILVLSCAFFGCVMSSLICLSVFCGFYFGGWGSPGGRRFFSLDFFFSIFYFHCNTYAFVGLLLRLYAPIVVTGLTLFNTHIILIIVYPINVYHGGLRSSR